MVAKKEEPTESKHPPKKQKGKVPKKPLLFSVSAKEKIFFAKHLSVMLKAGIPVREALEALTEQASTPSLRHILTISSQDIADGQVLAFGLEKFPRVFDAFFTNVVRVGEKSGTLSESLAYLANQMEKAREIRAKVRSALIYPIIVLVGALGIGGYLAFFILPKLLPLFTSLETELPATTRFLLASTNFTTRYWPWMIIGILVAILAFVAAYRLRKFKKSVHRAFLILPIFRTLVQQIQSTQFSLILGTLLTSGVKVVPALVITADSLGNLVYTDELHKIADRVERGETIGSQLKEHPRLFSRTTASMVDVGERTGKLSESLLTLAEFTEKEVDGRMKNLSALIEPLVLIVMGVLVGFIAFSIISPIYQLTQAVSI